MQLISITIIPPATLDDGYAGHAIDPLADSATIRY